VAAATSATGRVDHLDGIRAIAITGVLCMHWAAQYTPFGFGGTVGVDIFFVLSGFIITTLLWTWRGEGTVGAQYAQFLRRRVRRLYPALVGLCVATPLLWLVWPGTPYSTAEVLERSGLALVQLTWLPEALGDTMDPFRQTWSLASEWYFYLVWAPLVLRWRRTRAAVQVLRWTAAAAVVLYVVPAASFSSAWYYFSPPARFGEILAGAALALAMQASPGLAERVRVPDWVAALAVVLVAAYVVAAPNPYTDATALRWVGGPLAVAATLVLVVHGYGGSGPTLSLLRWRPVALLGQVSYSLYLWHFLPVYLIDKDVIALPKPALALLGVGTAAALTALSHRWLEKPFLSNRSDALAPAGRAR
jgi:peptidoglycan/LPS O-acetylase OafA/YrhL